MDLGGIGWGLQTVIGVLLLSAVLLWVLFRNRSTPEEDERTEEATHRLYEEEDAEHGHEDDDVP